MSPTLRAQLWEFCRTSWLGLLAHLAYLLAFMVFDYFVFFEPIAGDPRFNARGIPLMSLLGYIIFITANSNGLFGVGSRFSFRRGFTRPISTTQLVVAPMLFNVIAAVGLFLLPAALFAFLFGTSVPVAGPSALLASMVACCVASMWSSATAMGRWIGFALTSSTFVLALLMIDHRQEETLPYWTRTGASEYWTFPWYIYLGLAFLAAAAVAFTVFAVNRQRHGDSIGLAIPMITAPWSVPNKTRDLQPFRNQWTAQCWYEFQRIRKLLLFPVFLAPIFILAFVGVCNSLDPGWEESFYTWAGSVFICPLIYQLLCAVAGVHEMQHKSGPFSLSVFDATRPLRCDHLVTMRLLLVAGWSLVGWLMMVVAAVLQLRFIGYWENLTKLVESLSASVGEISVYWWMAGVVSVWLLYLGTTSTLLAFPSLAGIVVIIHIPIVILEIVGVWSRDLWIAYSYLLSVAVVVLCVFALRTALSSVFLNKTYFVVALSVWTIFVCTTIALTIKLSPAIPVWIPWSAYLIGAVMLLVPLAATAVAPQTLAIYRHA